MPFPATYLPWLSMVTFVATCVTSLAISSSLGHFSGIPYISDTGTTPPESCIFGQMLNMYALLLGLSIYKVYEKLPNQTRMEDVATTFGLLAAFLVSVVANFQETEIFIVHISAAMGAFTLANIYMWMRVALSKCQRRLRTFAAVGVSLSLLLTAIPGGIAFASFTGKDITHWGPNDGGYSFHIVSVISEWILAFFVNLFVVTLSAEMATYDEGEADPLLRGSGSRSGSRGDSRRESSHASVDPS